MKMKYKFIASFNKDHVVRWIAEYKRRQFFTWPMCGHAIIQFWPDQEPFIYKTLGGIHHASIKHLEELHPDGFFVAVIQESFSYYSRPKDSKLIFPKTNDVSKNTEIPGMVFEYNPGVLKIQIKHPHQRNEETVTTEKVYFTESDIFTDISDTIEVDFENRKIVSSIVEGVFTTS
jgi:hypothetical protein